MPNVRRFHPRRTTTATPPRSAPAECIDRSDGICQGCGDQEATEAHHWTYPSEEWTTADHLTGFRRFRHDLITWATWFVHRGGAPQILTELFPHLLRRPARTPRGLGAQEGRSGSAASCSEV